MRVDEQSNSKVGIENIFDDEVPIRSSTSGDNVRLELKNLNEELRFHSTDKTKRTLPFLSLSLRDRFFVVLTKKFLRLEKRFDAQIIIKIVSPPFSPRIFAIEIVLLDVRNVFPVGYDRWMLELGRSFRRDNEI